MKKLVWDDDVEEIDLGDGDFVSIAKAVNVKTMLTIGAAESQAEGSMALLRHLIKSWRGPSFVFPDGEAVPCSPEFIDKMDIRVANDLSAKLLSIVTGLGMDDESKNDSTENSQSI